MSKYSITDAQKIAIARGGRCLSDDLPVSSKSKLHWQCGNGHKWEARFSHVIYDGTWCPLCSRRDTLERMQETAALRGGKCLSDSFTSHHTKLIWECGHGHQWKAEPTTIVHRGSWCPYCDGKHQTIEDLKQLAIERGGKCLSTKYLGTLEKHSWECNRGHHWLAIPSSVKRGSWCLKCAKINVALSARIKTLDKIKSIASSKGGQCLSTIDEYGVGGSKIRLRCQFGHEWSCAPSSIIHVKSWCPKCHVPKNKYTIEKMQAIAKTHGGRCLSTTYKACELPLLWCCEKGHKFKASAKNIINCGSWCRECKERQIDIHDSINLARENGGRCLSQSVKSSYSLILWECSHGHRWRTNYSNAKEKWCQECSAINAKTELLKVS